MGLAESPPLAFLGGSALGLWSAALALLASTLALLGALIVIGWVAVRRLELRWWQRLLVLAAEAVLGFTAIALQVFSHG